MIPNLLSIISRAISNISDNAIIAKAKLYTLRYSNNSLYDDFKKTFSPFGLQLLIDKLCTSIYV
jgi:hypothetical protein